MERYKFLSEIGSGTSGCVFKALSLETSQIVAVKKMKRKFYDWEECISLREVKSLRRLNHQNIVKLKEIVRENNELFFVFEYMEHNLYQIMRERQTPFSEEDIRGLMFQMLQGLAYMHNNGYFHRDLKPENLLVTNEILKIADFGLAREVSSLPPYTDYVSTRWYRAPEVLLQSSSYTPAIDMWAVGAVLAELFTFCPIFPGDSEMDQLYKICCVLGIPDWTVFPNVGNVSQLVDLGFFGIMPADLSDVIPNASPAAIDLIKQLCSWDPAKRPTAKQCLQHPFFHVIPKSFPRQVGLWNSHQPVDPLQLTLSNIGSEPNLELNLWDFGTRTDDCFLGLSLAVKPSAGKIEMLHKSRGNEEDILCSGFQDDVKQSVFWSLFPPNNYGIAAPLESSLSLSFSTIPNSSSTGAPQSTGFTFTSLQPSILERPFLALSSGYQQSHCFN